MREVSCFFQKKLRSSQEEERRFQADVRLSKREWLMYTLRPQPEEREFSPLRQLQG